MKVYTYSQARQNLSDLLNEAEKGDEVIIRRKDGRNYIVSFQQENHSALDVEGIKSSVTWESLSRTIRENRDK